MVKKVIRTIQAFVLVGLIAIPIYSAIFRIELYPFAPYTMYSFRNKIEYTVFPRIYCETSNSKKLVTNKMWQPMDEARIGESFETSYYGKNYLQIQEKLESLHDHIITNKYECNSIVIDFKIYHTAEELLKDSGVALKTFRTAR